VVELRLLHRADRRARRAAAGSVRRARARCHLSRLRPAGVLRAAIVFGVLSAIPYGFTAPWVQNLFIFTLMYAALASAWNIVGGFSGYISLGHAAFFGVGAYAVGIIFTHTSIGGGYRPFYVLPLVGIGVAIASLPIAWVCYRTRAATFAIVTITLLFMTQQLAYNLRSLTNGSQGIAIPTPNFPVATYEVPFYYAMLGVLALSMLAAWFVRGSKLGLALFAIRDDEDRAAGLGVQTELAKLSSFAVSAGLVAMVGGVWAYYISFIYPQFAVDPLVTIGMVLMVYLGGRGTIWGPVLGAFILVPAQQYLAYRLGASELYLVGYSAVFLVVMLLLPRGILPSLRDRSRKLRVRRTPPGRRAKEVAAS
jgi:branched-chain amino acid transport system permease protein